jgi:hypothetical protein
MNLNIVLAALLGKQNVHFDSQRAYSLSSKTLTRSTPSQSAKPISNINSKRNVGSIIHGDAMELNNGMLPMITISKIQ